MKRSSCSLLTTMLLCLATLLAMPDSMLMAQDYELPNVSVTATRSERDLDKVARNVTVITREEIAVMNPRSVVDVLVSVPGLTIGDTTGTGVKATVDMRGFGLEGGGQNTLVLVDGRRQNAYDLSGVDFSTIPVENIERIEILHGPAGVLFGDMAMGGVVNIITRAGEGDFSGKLEAQTGSYETNRRSGYLQGVYNEKLSYFVSIRDFSTNGYRKNSRTEIRNATFDTRLYATDSLSIRLDGAVNTSNYRLPGGLTRAQIEDDRRQSSTPNDYGKDEKTTLSGQVMKDFGRYGVFTFDLNYNNRNSESQIWSILNSNIESFTMQPKYVWEGDLAGMNNTLTAGIDYSTVSYRDSSLSLFFGTTTKNDFGIDAMSIYLLEELSITPELIFSIGGRYQQTEFDLTTDSGVPASDSFSEDQNAWSVGLTYNFNEGSKVYARVARSFRYPTTQEYITWGKFMTGLKPEKALNYEVGAQYTFKPGARAWLSAYSMQVDDKIAYNSLTMANENLEKTRHQGVEASLVLPLGEMFNIQGSASYNDAVFDDGLYDGKRVPLVPEWKYSLGLSAKPLEGLFARVQLNYVGDQVVGSDKANQYDSLDDYTTVDVYLSYQLKGWKVFVQGKNIFDEKYLTNAWEDAWSYAGYPQATATWYGGLEYQF